MQLLNKYEKEARIQDYSGQTEIAGVEIISLDRFNDETGSFTELMRLEDGNSEIIPDFNLKQINFSKLDSEMIKAFHIHKQQTDIWFVPQDSKILLLLSDLREDSPTSDNMMRIVLGDGKSRLVVIPAGIAHGCKNLLKEKSEIIYFVDNQFDPAPDKCDEWRLPWNIFGEDVWELDKG